MGDAFLKALETVWRALVVFVSLIAIGTLGVATWVQIIAPVFFPPLKGEITTVAKYDDGSAVLPPVDGKEPFRCSEDYPLKIAFTNNSNTKIGSIEFSTHGREPNRSNDVLGGTGWRSTDMIIPPGYTSESCWGISVSSDYDAADLVYEVDIVGATETNIVFTPNASSGKGSRKPIEPENKFASPQSSPPLPAVPIEVNSWVGEYDGSFEGDAEGDLSVSALGDGRVSIALSVASSDCTGDIFGTGKIAADRLLIIKPRDESGNQCRLSLARRGKAIEINEEHCLYFHGFHCSFNGRIEKR